MVEKILSQSHPSHYLVHKYWGRKAHNLIATYLEHYTKKNDKVLDPFMGSGGVVIEAKKLGRQGFGVDINPITKLIVDNTLNNVDIDALEKSFYEIVDNIPSDITQLATTTCPKCIETSKLVNAVWSENNLIRVKGKCLQHGIFVKDAEDPDIETISRAAVLLKRYTKTENLYYPTDELFQFVRRNGRTHMDQLFSVRNLLISSYILNQIQKLNDDSIKNQLLMAFTSMLPNVSKMIPADPEKVTGKSGWQISKFWVPSTHTEKNVLDSFTSRVKLIVKAKNETKSIFSKSPHKIEITSAEDLSFIDSDSIDYVFTDPPYGDSIAYLGLSMFWNSWLKYAVNYESEIIYDTYRKKDEKDYSERLLKAFHETYRVLKPGKHMSFTFHNRHVKFWKIVIDAVSDSGFELESVVWQPQAVSSGTQGINRKNTLKGDFVYTFIKPRRTVTKKMLLDTRGDGIVIKTMQLLLEKSKFVETTNFYELVIPIIVKSRGFFDEKGKILNIDRVLAEHFQYIQVEGSHEYHYGWTKK